MELLSPAGNFDSLIAAVQSGADAVYLGFGGFNARRSAGNFTGDDIYRAVDYCHARGVNVHVTLNTLIKENELDGFADAVLTAARAGVDAAIVQDLGGAALIKQLCPTLKMHMSTQAACCNAAGVCFARDHGYDRVVLARECSLDEIALCARQGVEIETFAHGALCVCFSGQCLFSSLVGGRSGNRGMCAQPCRLNYELSGTQSARGHLLSPRDVMMLRDLKALRDAGVCSLKIEGRLKRPEYVSEVTRVYRRALDEMEEHPEHFEPDADAETALKQIFNRGGFSRAYLDSRFHDSDIMDITRPNNMGVRVGDVVRMRGGRVRMRLDTPLDAGDQIALRLDSAETGFELKQSLKAGECEITLAELKRVPDMTGAHIYRAASIRQLERARAACEGEHREVRVSMRADLRVGENARLSIHTAVDKNKSDIADIEVEATGAQLSPARKAPLTQEGVRAQLTKLGGTALYADAIDIALDENAFLPVSALNELRRAAVDKYMQRVLETRRGCLQPDAQTVDIPHGAHEKRRAAPVLIVQSRTLIDGALGDALYWEPERVAREELQMSLSSYSGDAPIYLRVPNMLTQGELNQINDFANDNAAALRGCVLTNVSQLQLIWPGEKIADMNLNAWNSHTLGVLKGCGIGRTTAPLELTAGEIQSADCEGMQRELIIYGRAALMTMRHCPVNGLKGLSHPDCRLCDAGKGLEQCSLIDRKRAAFPLRRYRGASGCYTQILNSARHDLRGRLNRLPACDAVRIIFTDESSDMKKDIARGAREALAALQKGSAAGVAPVNGATAGHYFRGVE